MLSTFPYVSCYLFVQIRGVSYIMQDGIMASFMNDERIRRSTDRLSSTGKLMLVIALASSLLVLSSASSVAAELNIQTACSETPYPDSCVAALFTDLGSLQAGSVVPVGIAVEALIVEVEKAFLLASGISGQAAGQVGQIALEDCVELLDVTRALSDMSKFSLKQATPDAGSVHTWISACMTNQDTCMDGLESADGNVRDLLAGSLRVLSKLSSGLLAMIEEFSDGEDSADHSTVPDLHNRRLLSEQREPALRSHDDRTSRLGSVEGHFPLWLSAGDRRLLQAFHDNVEADLVVSKDGTGNYTTITDAVNAAPNQSSQRFVIRVKAGVYQESVEISVNKTNLMFIGDGMDATVVRAGRNIVDGSTTYRSATFAAVGTGFMARDMSFENTAGPSKYQAVALRVGSDKSVLYRCSIKGYQDTLYAHSLRQFYRECQIYGTVDFIFGNAAAVFQSCTLLVRKPLDNQQNIITAQGRGDPNQNTGISIHDCNVTAAPDLVPFKNSFQTYLGRPWKRYSRTVFMESYLDGLIRPEGWLEWSGDFALDTLYYGEYMNFGPGAGLANRVKWPGYRVMNGSPGEASRFTVAQFIEGNTWLPSTGVQYAAGLAV